ncbi:MAG: glycosyltransferase 61 family protein [Planctomycetota bacterium]
MPPDPEEPIVLRVADFGLPEIAEPPDGMVELRNSVLWPGANGLHDSAGRPIEESCLRRGFALDYYPHGRPEPLDAPSRALAAASDPFRRIVYLPYARMVHFGHLLTEFAGNVGPLLAHPQGVDGIGGEDCVLMVSARSHGSTAALAELLGVPVQRVRSTADLSGPARAVAAVIPRPSMMNRHGLATRHFSHVRHVLDRLFGVGPRLATLAETSGVGKLYLSRSRLAPGMRRIRDEEAMEADLARRGWRILHPQELPVAEQLEGLAAAHTIAGCVGSALHLLMAFGEGAGGRRLIALGSTVSRTNPNVVLQAARQRVPFRHVVCLEPEADAASSPVHEFGFMMSPTRIAERLDALASGALV